MEKPILTKTFEITYEVSYYHVNRWDPRRYGAVMSISKKYITKRYSIDMINASYYMWQLKLILKYPHVYEGNDVKVVRSRVIDFEEFGKRHHRHGNVLGDPRFRDFDEILVF